MAVDALRHVVFQRGKAGRWSPPRLQQSTPLPLAVAASCSSRAAAAPSPEHIGAAPLDLCPWSVGDGFCSHFLALLCMGNVV